MDVCADNEPVVTEDKFDRLENVGCVCRPETSELLVPFREFLPKTGGMIDEDVEPFGCFVKAGFELATPSFLLRELARRPLEG
jgi:hypothetical protein